MILSDLTGAPVTCGPAKLGVVIDLRFVVSGRPHELLADAELVGVIVGSRAGRSFMGYERAGLSAPWPLAQILRRRRRASFLVAWEDIVTLQPDGIEVRPGFIRHSSILDGP